MADRLRQLWQRILNWWNGFSARQKTIIITVAVLLVVGIAVLVTFLTRDKYVPLVSCEDTKQTSEIMELLDGEGLKYQVSEDGLSIRILEEQQSDANLLLGANDIQSSAYSIDNVTDGGISTTEADKQKKYVVYLEKQLENDFLKQFNAIKSAHVELSVPDDDGTLISTNEESYATVLLELQDEFSSEQAAYLARAVATAIGNKSTDNIVIMDTDGNMLFSGDENYSSSGTANTQLSVKNQAESLVKNEVKSVMLGTNEFDAVEVACNLSLDFTTSEETTHRYYAPDGQTQGVLSHEDVYSSENESGVGGVPGTDSNTENDTTYVIRDTSTDSSSVTEESRDYLPNEDILVKTIPAGLIDYENSSISLTCINYNVIREEDADAQGLLAGVTWDEYKLANKDRTKLDVDDDMFDLVSKATGIAKGNIAIVAYRENVFFDQERSGIRATDIIQIILIVVILGLLAFVIIRSMAGDKEEEPEEEELSVEAILQSTPEPEIENIAMEEESEIKKMINKFVEDNPEAAANLLRNWLNEEWG